MRSMGGSALLDGAGPELGVRHLTRAIEHDGERQRRQPVAKGFGNVYRIIAADQGRVIQAELFREFNHFCRLIDGDAYNLKPFRT